MLLLGALRYFWSGGWSMLRVTRKVGLGCACGFSGLLILSFQLEWFCRWGGGVCCAV